MGWTYWLASTEYNIKYGRSPGMSLPRLGYKRPWLPSGACFPSLGPFGLLALWEAHCHAIRWPMERPMSWGAGAKHLVNEFTWAEPSDEITAPANSLMATSWKCSWATGPSLWAGEEGTRESAFLTSFWDPLVWLVQGHFEKQGPRRSWK